MVDYWLQAPYLGAMANRLILTLLALLTGLAAQTAPANARGVEVPAAQQVALVSEVTAAKARRAPVALARLPRPGLRSARAHAPVPRFARVPVASLAPSVLTGIDRARQ